jgi:septum formation inhibitor MinC
MRIDLTTNLELNIDTPTNAPQPMAVEIRYGQMGLVLVRIRTADPGTILDELTGRIATAPHFFRRTGICLDLSALENTPGVAEVRTVIDAIRRAGMLAIGLAGDSAEIDTVSNALNLPILSGFRAARSRRRHRQRLRQHWHRQYRHRQQKRLRWRSLRSRASPP